VLLSVLTPRYLRTDQCMREVSAFCASAKRKGGLVVNNGSRLFKILKMLIEATNALPPELNEQTGFEFFTVRDGVPG
jgi:hypothetical protein